MSGFERKTEKKPNQPVVFVLGFGGSKKKHLAKYAQLHIKQGYEVAIYVTPMLAIRKFEDCVSFAEDLYVKGDFRNEGHRPICFHIMSMVGISVFGCFWEILPNKPNGQFIKSQTIGLIFDSGPTPIAIPSRASIAVSTAKYPPSQQDFLTNFKRSLSYFFTFLLYTYLRLLTIISKRQQHKICTFYRLKLMTDLPLNQLYLYSKADDVIYWRYVEEFIEFQRLRPRSKVWARCFEDSPHVQHLLKYPEEYEQLTSQFTTQSVTFSMAAFLNKVRAVKSNAKAPIVYMLGWGGAKDKQLNRYSQIYEDIGCNVIRYTPPFGKLSGRSFTSYEKYALDFYDRAFIDAKSDPDKPIVFHAFSMNGASVFIKFWDLLSSYPDGDKLKSRVKGFVFDSAPSDTVPQTSAIAFSLATFPPNTGFLSSIGRFAMYLLVYCYVGIFRAFQYFKWITFDPSIWEREIAYYRILKIKDLPRNQLYLYSKIDVMIRAKDVDNFIDHQKNMGANITSKCWPDSPHIQHLRVHPDEYQELCTSFVNEIMKESN